MTIRWYRARMVIDYYTRTRYQHSRGIRGHRGQLASSNWETNGKKNNLFCIVTRVSCIVWQQENDVCVESLNTWTRCRHSPRLCGYFVNLVADNADTDKVSPTLTPRTRRPPDCWPYYVAEGTSSYTDLERQPGERAYTITHGGHILNSRNQYRN